MHAVQVLQKKRPKLASLYLLDIDIYLPNAGIFLPLIIGSPFSILILYL